MGGMKQLLYELDAVTKSQEKARTDRMCFCSRETPYPVSSTKFILVCPYGTLEP